MKKIIILIVFGAVFFYPSAFSQIFYWERIYDGIINSDTICNAYSGGFSFPIQSRPTVFNLDEDGDLDFFIGNSNTGKIDYLKNNGTFEDPCWDIASRNFANINLQVGIPSPFFVDLNGDSLPDLITGDYLNGGNGGTVHYYINNSSGNNFQFILEDDTLGGIDAYDDSYPIAEDVDNDGDIDLIVGGGLGDVYFCRNKGNNQWATPVKIFQQFGYEDDKASPALGDLDGDGIPELLVGSAYTDIKLFKIDSIGQDTVLWELENLNYFVLDSFGYSNPCYLNGYTTPILRYFDTDSLLDLLLCIGGNQFVIHKNIGTTDSAIWAQGVKYFPDFNFLSLNNVSIEELNNDGNEELFIPHSCNKLFTIYENNNFDDTPNWELFNTLIVDSLLSLPINLPNSLFDINDYVLIDYDGDNSKDIIIRKITNPTLAFYKNVSTLEGYHFNYTPDTLLESIFNVGSEGFVSAGDLDDDDKIDFIMYNDDTQMKEHYEHVLLPSPHLELISSNFEPNIHGVPTIIDFDFDEKTDLVTKNSNALYFYKNIGTAASPIYQLQTSSTNIGLSGIENGWKIKFANIDGNCGADIYTSTANGILAWGFRGVKPKIIQPVSTTFEVCDTSVIALTANPPGGVWEGVVDSNGNFTPSSFSSPGEYWMIYSYTDPGGCYSKKDSLLINIVDCSVSTIETLEKNVVSIFPNPANDDLYIKYFVDSGVSVNITLFDVSGVKRLILFEGVAMGDNSFKWTRPLEFTAGIYLITFSTDNQCITKKVILE